jgi:hypothetical protein
LQTVTVDEGTNSGSRLQRIYPAELVFVDAVFHDFPISLPAPLEKLRKELTKSLETCPAADKIEKDQVKLAINLGAMKQDLQFRSEARARRFLRMHDLVQAAVQLAQQPLQDAEEEVFLGWEVIECPTLARLRSGHDGIQCSRLDSSFQDLRVACPLERFSPSTNEFGIGPAWTHDRQNDSMS